MSTTAQNRLAAAFYEFAPGIEYFNVAFDKEWTVQQDFNLGLAADMPLVLDPARPFGTVWLDSRFVRQIIFESPGWAHVYGSYNIFWFSLAYVYPGSLFWPENRRLSINAFSCVGTFLWKPENHQVFGPIFFHSDYPSFLYRFRARMLKLRSAQLRHIKNFNYYSTYEELIAIKLCTY